jgi:hypothetical protein
MLTDWLKQATSRAGSPPKPTLLMHMEEAFGDLPPLNVDHLLTVYSDLMGSSEKSF